MVECRFGFVTFLKSSTHSPDKLNHLVDKLETEMEKELFHLLGSLEELFHLLGSLEELFHLLGSLKLAVFYLRIGGLYSGANHSSNATKWL